MGEMAIDKSRWPIVVVRLDGKLTDAEFTKGWDELDGLLKQNRRYGIVADLTKVDTISPKQRAEVARRWKENFAAAKRVCVAAGWAVSSPLARGVLTAISWIQAQPHPSAYFATAEQAEEYVINKLREDGLLP